jgi:hypothetical protein
MLQYTNHPKVLIERLRWSSFDETPTERESNDCRECQHCNRFRQGNTAGLVHRALHTSSPPRCHHRRGERAARCGPRQQYGCEAHQGRRQPGQSAAATVAQGAGSATARCHSAAARRPQAQRLTNLKRTGPFRIAVGVFRLLWGFRDRRQNHR